MKKIYLVLFCILFISGCSNELNDNIIEEREVLNDKEASNEDNVNNKSSKEAYDFTTNKVTVMKTVPEALQNNELEIIVEIEDEEIINEIIKASDMNNWVQVPFEEEIAAEPDYYISFNNGVIIQMLKDIPYGIVMNYEIVDGLYTYSNGKKKYYFTEEFANIFTREIAVVTRYEINQLNLIESFYQIDKAFVDAFYNLDTKEINYDKIELNYEAYPTLEASMGIEIINIDLDNVNDIRPVLPEYIKTLKDDFEYDGKDIKTNQDYHDFINKQPVPKSTYENAIEWHPELSVYGLGELTYKIYYDAIEYNEDNSPYFDEEVREYYETKNITERDWIYLDHVYRSFEGVKQLSDEELIDALVEEYEFKQIKCKQYLALYAINKIYGE